jgi:hypothetical protein
MPKINDILIKKKKENLYYNKDWVGFNQAHIYDNEEIDSIEISPSYDYKFVKVGSDGKVVDYYKSIILSG